MGLYRRPLMLAHRCIIPGYPENSIFSLQKAIEFGVDYVEVDCRFTKDKVMVNIHNDIYDGDTGKTILIEDIPYDTICKYDIGMNQRIPTLEEVFQCIAPSHIYIELDIKNEEVLNYEDNPDNNIMELLMKYQLTQRANINLSIFMPADFIRENEKYRKEQFRFTYNAFDLTENLLKELKKRDFFGLDLRYDRLTKENVDLIHKYNLEVQSYPIDDVNIMKQLIRADVDVIQTNRVDLLKQMLIDEGKL